MMPKAVPFITDINFNIDAWLHHLFFIPVHSCLFLSGQEWTRITERWCNQEKWHRNKLDFGAKIQSNFGTYKNGGITQPPLFTLTPKRRFFSGRGLIMTHSWFHHPKFGGLFWPCGYQPYFSSVLPILSWFWVHNLSTHMHHDTVQSTRFGSATSCTSQTTAYNKKSFIW